MTAPPFPLFKTIKALRAQAAAWRADNLRIGLVPTMGALHAGHLSLVEHIAPQIDRIILSIFVNPSQFSADEDFTTYPRQLADDLAVLADAPVPVHAVFAPSVAAMYPPDFATSITMQGVAKGLEAAHRPHFFDGVALVVGKLLQQSQCDTAIFGEKDYQQLLVIRQLVRDLNLSVEILGAPIMREADGLAMSSRNIYLTSAQRKIAAQLNRILAELAASRAEIATAESQAEAALLAAGFDAVDYACLRDGDTLQPITPRTKNRRALIAARLGSIRLIDNMSPKSNPIRPVHRA